MAPEDMLSLSPPWESFSHSLAMLSDPVCFCFFSWLKNKVKYPFWFPSLPPIQICYRSVSKLPWPVGVRWYAASSWPYLLSSAGTGAVLDHPPLWVTAHLSARPALGEDGGQKDHVVRALRQPCDDGIGLEIMSFSKSRELVQWILKESCQEQQGPVSKCVLVREASPTLSEVQVAGRMSVDLTLGGFSPHWVQSFLHLWWACIPIRL